MHNVVWGCGETLPRNLFQTTGFRCLPLRNSFLFPFLFVNSHAWFTRPHPYSVTYVRNKDTTPSFISRGLSSRIQSIECLIRRALTEKKNSHLFKISLTPIHQESVLTSHFQLRFEFPAGLKQFIDKILFQYVPRNLVSPSNEDMSVELLVASASPKNSNYQFTVSLLIRSAHYTS